jgi:ubiquinone/menaquinone biosynthesis C-methylase UbiE
MVKDFRANRIAWSVVESSLRAHPGVRNVAVVESTTESGEDRRAAYIVPDESYFDAFIAQAGEERKRMQRWRKTFDLSQMGKPAHSGEPGFNIAGWNSSYTRQPIPADEMREWVDVTVKEILTFQPDRVLELGCGTGLLLFRIAPNSQRYVGVDFAPAVLKQLKKQMEELPGPWTNVTVLERSAEDFEGFADESFDTVIVNSVVKYFPSAAFLARVLEQAARVVRPGGRIFIGDVRNLALLEAYAVSIELYQALPTMTLFEFRERVQRRILFEDQLVVSPRFFLATPRRSPKISRVEIRPRLGTSDNEMTRFRYNAILHMASGSRQELVQPGWVEWRERKPNLDAIGALLKPGPETLAIQGIANARVERDVRALAALSEVHGTGTVRDFSKALDQAALQGVDPQKLWWLGEKSGYRVDLSWAGGESDGSYDVVFGKELPGGGPPQGSIQWPKREGVANDLTPQTTVPGRGTLREMLVQQLTEHLRSRHPEDGTPTAIFAMDALPTKDHGEIDRDLLAGLRN